MLHQFPLVGGSNDLLIGWSWFVGPEEVIYEVARMNDIEIISIAYQLGVFTHTVMVGELTADMLVGKEGNTNILPIIVKGDFRPSRVLMGRDGLRSSLFNSRP